MTSQHQVAEDGEQDEVAMTVRFPRPLHRALRKARFDYEVVMNTLVNEGVMLRLAALDDTFARALADTDPGSLTAWGDKSEATRDGYRAQARKIMELLGAGSVPGGPAPQSISRKRARAEES